MQNIPTVNDLRYRIDIVQPDDASEDGYGDPGVTAVMSNVPANVIDLGGIELVRAQMIADKATHKVFARYDSRIQEKQAVIFESRTFRIEDVSDASVPGCGFPRHRWLILLCVEIASE